MREFFQKLEDMMVAATFAEAGEWETAREMIPPVKSGEGLGSMERMFGAVAFAEAGLFDEAVRFSGLAGPKTSPPPVQDEGFGAAGIYMTFGTVSIEA